MSSFAHELGRRMTKGEKIMIAVWTIAVMLATNGMITHRNGIMTIAVVGIGGGLFIAAHIAISWWRVGSETVYFGPSDTLVLDVPQECLGLTYDRTTDTSVITVTYEGRMWCFTRPGIVKPSALCFTLNTTRNEVELLSS